MVKLDSSHYLTAQAVL